MIALYQNIKDRRNELGLSQGDLARLIGYRDKSMVSRVESGQVDLSQSKIELFASALRTTPAALMGWNESCDSAAADPLSSDERALLSDYQKLNELGKEKARIDVADLTEIPKYTEKERSDSGVMAG